MAIAFGSPDWSKEHDDWPFAKKSRFVSEGKHRWHVQRFGEGPPILLLHGTAASSHSFADLARLLAPQHELLLIDLPAHGFTRSPPFHAATPQSVAADIEQLLDKEIFEPQVIVGHSAGAAVAFELARRLATRPDVIAINGAFKPFRGLAKLMAPVVAKLMHLNPLTAFAVAQAARTDDTWVERLIEQTGSKLNPGQVDLYARLLRYPGHISGALGMMANWSLDGMTNTIVASGFPLMLVVGEQDRAVDPSESRSLHEAAPHTNLHLLPGGHLVHEEDPDAVAAVIANVCARRASDGSVNHQEADHEAAG